jgi:hypothetical protein
VWEGEVYVEQRGQTHCRLLLQQHHLTREREISLSRTQTFYFRLFYSAHLSLSAFFFVRFHCSLSLIFLSYQLTVSVEEAKAVLRSAVLKRESERHSRRPLPQWSAEEEKADGEGADNGEDERKRRNVSLSLSLPLLPSRSLATILFVYVCLFLSLSPLSLSQSLSQSLLCLCLYLCLDLYVSSSFSCYLSLRFFCPTATRSRRHSG